MNKSCNQCKNMDRGLSVSSLVFLRRLLAKLLGGLFMQSFLGHEEASGLRIDANGATRANWGGPTRALYLAAWGPPFRSSGLRLLTSFAPRSSSFQNNDPCKFSAHLDVVWVPETSKYTRAQLVVDEARQRREREAARAREAERDRALGIGRAHV